MLRELFEKRHRNLRSTNNKVKFTYKKYIRACEAIAEDIKKNFDLDKIELVGIARGGLPMLVTLSHMLGIRQISMIQTQMSNSDNCHDYGKFRFLNDCVTNSDKECVLLEDIVFKGTTTNGVIEILKERGKKVAAAYSLIIDKGFKNITISNDDVDIMYCYEINEDDWCYFYWEEDLDKLKL